MMKTGRILFLGLLAGLLCFVPPLFLSMAPLVAVRRGLGRKPFLLGSLFCLGVPLASGYPLGVFLACATVFTVAWAVEWEEREKNPAIIHLGSALLTVVLMVGFFYAADKNGIHVAGFFQRELDSVVLNMKKMLPESEITSDGLTKQLPSLLFIYCSISLWVGALSERWFRKWAHFAADPILALVRYKSPEALIWVFFASVAGTFLQHDYEVIKTVATNGLNVLLVCYFFQGMAVTEIFFRSAHIQGLWKSLGYFMCLSQLTLLVSIIGLMDYWMNFRLKISNKSKETTTF